MKEFSIDISIPRFKEEQTVIRESAQLLNSFLELCEKAPDSVIESDLQLFFDTYRRLDAIHQDLSSSKWSHGCEMGNVAETILMTSKSKFDDLGICIQCAFDNDRVEMLKGFDQICAVF